MVEFKMIMSNWNYYLVPCNGNSKEKYYILGELHELWGHRFGWGSKEKNLDKLIKGVDFDTDNQDYTQMCKIARGAPTVNMKNMPVAILTKKI